MLEPVLDYLRLFIEKCQQTFGLARAGALFNTDEIVRRAFVNNAFDGALTILGIIMGAAGVGIVDSKLVISSGFGACLAMGVSGACGRYFSERAERKRALHEMEDHMFRSLEGSMLEKASRTAALWIALVDGLSPAIAAAIPLLPLFLIQAKILTVGLGLAISVTLNLAVLFALGMFIGRVAEENVWLHGALMVAVGAITSLAIFTITRF